MAATVISEEDHTRADTARDECYNTLLYGATVSGTEVIPAIFPTVPELAKTAGLRNLINSIACAIDRLAVRPKSHVPPKGIIPANLSGTDISTYFDGTGLGTSGEYVGYAICNGNNGTPDLRGRFMRFPGTWTTGAGTTGGSDTNSHTHAIDHTHASTGVGTSGSAGTATSYSGNSGSPSSTENRPAFIEMVPLMRLT